MNRCTLCNSILWPWESKKDGAHADCHIAMRVGFELGRRERLHVVKAFLADPDAGNALTVRRLRQFCAAVEAKQASTVTTTPPPPDADGAA